MLGDRLVRLGEMANAESAGDGVEGRVRERQRFRVALLESHAREPPARLVEHRLREVDAGRLRTALRAAARDVARSAGNVEKQRAVGNFSAIEQFRGDSRRDRAEVIVIRAGLGGPACQLVLLERGGLEDQGTRFRSHTATIGPMLPLVSSVGIIVYFALKLPVRKRHCVS